MRPRQATKKANRFAPKISGGGTGGMTEQNPLRNRHSSCRKNAAPTPKSLTQISGKKSKRGNDKREGVEFCGNYTSAVPSLINHRGANLHLLPDPGGAEHERADHATPPAANAELPDLSTEE